MSLPGLIGHAVLAPARLATGFAGLAARGVRFAGFACSGANPCTVGGPSGMMAAARGLFEPEQARHTRRVWTQSGHAEVELAAPAAEGGPDVRVTLRRRLERLDGVDWAAVNDVLGRVLVAFDERRVGLDDVIGVVARVERARDGRQEFRHRDEHPADLEPLVAAATALCVHATATGGAWLGKLLPVPALTRHATAVLALLETQPGLRRALADRIGSTGVDLVFSGTSALLHVLTQSVTMPALNTAAAAQRIVEVASRRAVWLAREGQLCAREYAGVTGCPAAERPSPLPPGPIETYLARRDPATLAGAVGLLALTRRPSRSADLLKGLSAKAALQGRETFATVLDLLMCHDGVLPVDGSAYRRLDRIDAVVLDGDVLCADPLAGPLRDAVIGAGHRLVITEHEHEVAEQTRRLQNDGYGVLVVSARDDPGLLAADVGIAPVRLGHRPAWGADLLTGPGLDQAWLLVTATGRARTLGRRVVGIALTGNVLGGLLAAVGDPALGQRRASNPGKTATMVNMALGTATAVRLATLRPPQ